MVVIVIESLMRKTETTDEEVLKQYDNEQQRSVIMGKERKKNGEKLKQNGERPKYNEERWKDKTADWNSFA